MKQWTAKEFIHKVPSLRLEDLADREEQVKEIIGQVKENGDQAVREFTLAFDQQEIDDLKIPEEKMIKAYENLDDEEKGALVEAQKRISAFCEKQRQSSWFDTEDSGSILGQLVLPLDRVGIYVPGGKAPYPSSVLMNALPAKAAGVKEIFMCTPPRDSGKCDQRVLAAAHLAGVTRVYRIGGVQAIAALAFGTQTIPRVDKIVGPGNAYVTAAKKMVFGQVDIDMLAGPSEVMILADKTADPAWAAADLLSQAEHDPQSSSLLVTMDRVWGKKVIQQVKEQLSDLRESETAALSIENRGAVIWADNKDEALEVINHYAPEHLEIMTADPYAWLGGIRHAGSIFLGPHSPEPVGDYTAGPNHVLPTGGTARFFSTLGVDSFIKKSNVIAMSSQGLEDLRKSTTRLAAMEGFEAHKKAVAIRRERS